MQVEDEAWGNFAFLKPIDDFQIHFMERIKPVTDILDIPVNLIASATGQDSGTSTWIFAMVSVFVLSLGLSLIGNPRCRKWYSTSIGLFFGFYVNGLGYSFVLLMFTSVYPVMVVLPRRQASIVGTILALIMLSLGNFYVWYLGLGKSDFSFVF